MKLGVGSKASLQEDAQKDGCNIFISSCRNLCLGFILIHGVNLLRRFFHNDTSPDKK